MTTKTKAAANAPGPDGPARFRQRAFRTFANLPDKNSLKDLRPRGRLWVFSLCFLDARSNGVKETSIPYLQKMEKLYEASQAAIDVSKVIRQLSTDNEFVSWCPVRLASFADLPERLTSFAILAGAHTKVLGKTKLKRRALFRNLLYAQLLEFIRLSTGSWRYKDLTDLYQEVSARECFTEDALRRRRERFEEDSPIFYQIALRRAKEIYDGYVEDDFCEELSRGLADALANYGAHNMGVAGAPDEKTS